VETVFAFVPASKCDIKKNNFSNAGMIVFFVSHVINSCFDSLFAYMVISCINMHTVLSFCIVRATHEDVDSDTVSVNTDDFGEEHTVTVSVHTNDFGEEFSQPNLETLPI